MTSACTHRAGGDDQRQHGDHTHYRRQTQRSPKPERHASFPSATTAATFPTNKAARTLTALSGRAFTLYGRNNNPAETTQMAFATSFRGRDAKNGSMDLENGDPRDLRFRSYAERSCGSSSS